MRRESSTPHGKWSEQSFVRGFSRCPIVSRAPKNELAAQSVLRKIFSVRSGTSCNQALIGGMGGYVNVGSGSLQNHQVPSKLLYLQKQFSGVVLFWSVRIVWSSFVTLQVPQSS